MSTQGTRNTVQDRKNIYLAKRTAIEAQLEALAVLLQQHQDQATDSQYHWGFIGDLDAMRSTLNKLLVPEEA